MKPSHFPDLPSDWITETDHFSSEIDSAALFMTIWRKKAPKEGRALLIVHGFGEHGGRYEHAPHYLKNSVDFIGAIDLRGHGRSQGLRGHVKSYAEYISDFKSAITRFRARLEQWAPRVELHVLGHSNGGLVVFLATQQDETLPIRSVSISSPLLQLKMQVPASKKFFASLIRPAFGAIQMTNEIDSGYLTHDSELNLLYETDQLNHNKITPQHFLEMNKAMEEASHYSKPFAYPIQFQVPLEDPIVSAEHVQKIFSELKLKPGVDKQLATYAGFFHESYNEVGKEKVFGDLEQWIRKHSSQA
ncbi:MAG: alpha/beta fold hydrolase [Xanthomonadaceae bacterium]|nr:alpha/beta fold hydrolase [Xanthomonadaceae bacterium]